MRFNEVGVSRFGWSEVQPSETVKSLLSECVSTEPECNVLSEGKAGESKNGSRPKIYTLVYKLSFGDFLFS